MTHRTEEARPTAEPATSLPKLMTEREAAEQLRIPVRTLRHLRTTGQVTYLKLGKGCRYTQEHLQQLMDSRECKSSDSRSAITGSAKTARGHGAVHGSTRHHVKPGALHLAQAILSARS